MPKFIEKSLVGSILGLLLPTLPLAAAEMTVSPDDTEILEETQQLSSEATPAPVPVPTQLPASNESAEALDFSLEPIPTRDESALSNAYADNSMNQVTSVSQLRDVSPGDWAFEALRSLVERYGCIAGYPDSTFRGDRAMTRYEFAAGLNACLQQIERLITNLDFVTREDLETLQRLVNEFETELATLGGRVDNLEGQVAFLEDHQFSTTTKFLGRVIFSLTSAFGDEKAVPTGATPGSEGDVEDNVVFDDRVRLNFNTSFTGRDLLKVRLDALNTTRFNVGITGTNMTRLAFDRPLDNDVRIGKLFYRFPLTPNLRFTVDATRGRFNGNVSDHFNRFFANPYRGAISNFGRFNPIYIQGAGGAGVTAVYDFSDSLSLSAGYLARNPNDPNEKKGLFNGSFAALAQLAFEPMETLSLGATYVRAYYPGGEAFVSGGTGSRLANAPFGQTATSADHFGLQANWRVTPKVTLAGWAGLTLAEAEADGVGFGGVDVFEGDDATLFNWAVTLAFPDLGKEGSLAGFIVGQQPKVTDNDSGPEDGDTSLHLEAQYRYPLTNQISINPGLIVILNPEHNDDNDTIYVGTIRTIFEF